ncbi:ketopantoate reductase family protein [Elioraea rosea]|uniref:ketopantoate reductase family protein n=1 Tax=Elioraea rosea TaxID=2492390 RepID=UPI0011835D71|nr:2-dehydropantoate 2-reductase [Elioraea rosea]
MRVAVFGAGAIGGHVAFRLARGGADVSVVARGAQGAAIAEKGIRVITPELDETRRVTCSADPAALGAQDAVIVTTKATALPEVAKAIGPLLGPDTPVAYVTNGIPWWYFHKEGGRHEGTRLDALDPSGALWDGVGIARTIGGVVYSACTVIEPGVVKVAQAKSRVILGEPDGSISDRAKALSAALEAGGMGGPVVPDIRTAVWEKLSGNVASGPLSILTGKGLSGMIGDPVLRAAGIEAMEECLRIAAAYGCDVKLDVAARLDQWGGFTHKPSILQDLELGRPMEVDAQFTVPLKLARMVGVETPTLDLLVALAAARANAAGLYAG